MSTESSVVVALREVRRLELERQRREEEARQRAAQEEEDRYRMEAAQRASIQYGQGMAPQGWNPASGDAGPESYVHPVRRTSEVVPLSASNGGEYQDASPYVQVPGPTTWEAPPQVQQKPRGGTVVKTMFLTLVVCAAGAGFGYTQLEKKNVAERDELRRAKITVDQDLADAVAARSKAEQELKVRVADLESKLAMANTKASVASSALMQAAAAANKMTEAHVAGPLPKNGRGAFRGRAARMAALRARAAASRAEAPPPPAAPVKSPKVAKKKAVSDDPLGGLRL